MESGKLKIEHRVFLLVSVVLILAVVSALFVIMSPTPHRYDVTKRCPAQAVGVNIGITIDRSSLPFQGDRLTARAVGLPSTDVVWNDGSTGSIYVQTIGSSHEAEVGFISKRNPALMCEAIIS